MESLDMVDLERGTKVAGFRGYFLKNDGVLLSFAIWQHALNHFFKKRFYTNDCAITCPSENLLLVQDICHKEKMICIKLKMENTLWYCGGGNHGISYGRSFGQKSLPKKFLSFSPCFRREAGAYSKDVKGLIRVHEFYKVEQVILCEASHEESVKYHEFLHRNTEEFIETLGIPYHTVINCAGDLGLGQVKKYDIELWVPLEEKYREIGSTSYFHDFQTRRCGYSL